MGDSAATGMEGWVYYLSSSKLRLNHPSKRYLIIAGNRASSFKDKPKAGAESPVRAGIIDPDTRVTDQGRETVHGRVFFAFSVHDPYVPEAKLRIGLPNAEDAAKWMQAFRDVTAKALPPGNIKTFLPTAQGRRRLTNLRRSGRRGSGLVRDVSGGSGHLLREDSTPALQGDMPNWTGTLLAKDRSPDVVASSPWQIFGCKNGLRFFEETSDSDDNFQQKISGDDSSTLMAVGVVNASPASVFDTVMALGPSRSEWDFCFYQGRVVEHVHGHLDIVHKQFHSKWFPWRMKPRDWVFQRYWRRDDDGTYVILYNSVKHDKCPPSKKFKRAWLQSGGYIISPLKGRNGDVNRCTVMHILKVDWRDWRMLWGKSRNRTMTLLMLERIAAIRELYKVKDKPIISAKPEIRKRSEEIFYESTEGQSESANVESKEDRPAMQPTSEESESKFLVIADDEFFDADEDQVSWEGGLEHDLMYSDEMEGSSMDEAEREPFNHAPNAVSKAATIVKRLQDLTLAGQKYPSFSRTSGSKSCTDDADLEFMRQESSLGATMWEAAEPGTFLIRGKRYLRDQKKVKAGTPLMQLVAADWFKSNKREDHIAARDGCVIQKLFAKQKSAQKVAESYFVVINLQVPGTPTYSLVLYYMANKRLQDIPLLENFVRGDNHFRGSRFKLCPHVAKGSWIVKQSVGKSACLIGEALDITYFSSDNYLELDIDIGSSSVARGVVNLVMGYVTKLVLELAFLVQANTEEELPEKLLGTVRISNLELSKAVYPPPELEVT